MAYLQSMEFSSTKTKLTCHRLKQILHEKINATNKLSRKHVYTSKKTSEQIYIEKIEDMPRNKCGICKQLKFEKNKRSIRKYLKTLYMDLDEKDKTFTLEIICASCKRSLENGKFP